jgi:hypothetical protein
MGNSNDESLELDILERMPFQTTFSASQRLQHTTLPPIYLAVSLKSRINVIDRGSSLVT